MKKITREEIRYYLSHPSSKDELQRQALDIRKKMAELDSQHSGIEREILETVQVAVHYDMGGGSSETGEKKDLSHVLDLTKRMLEGQREELYTEYQSIIEQMEKIHRLQIVYDTLSPLTREVLRRLWEENEKWEYIEIDMKISRRKIASIRKQALADIQNRFNSELTNFELVRQRNTAFFKYQNPKCEQAKEKKETITGQLSLETMNNT